MDTRAQQESWLSADVCRRYCMQQKRVHQDYIPRRCGILDDLKRYSVDHLNSLVKPSDTLRGVARSA